MPHEQLKWKKVMLFNSLFCRKNVKKMIYNLVFFKLIQFCITEKRLFGYFKESLLVR